MEKFSATLLVTKATERTLLTELLENLSWQVQAPSPPFSNDIQGKSDHMPDLLMVDTAFFEDTPEKVRNFIHYKRKVQLCVVVLGNHQNPRPWIAMGFDDSVKLSSSRAVLDARIHLYRRIIEQSRAAAEYSYKIWNSTLEAINQPIMIVDKDFNIQLANSSQCMVLDTSPEQLKNKKCWNAFEPHRKFAHRGRPLKKILVQGKKKQESFDIRINDREYLVSCMPMFDTKGELEAVIHVAHDITEKKIAEKRLQQADKMEALGRLAGSVAHDFNNLLMVIQSHAQMLSDQLIPSDNMLSDIDAIMAAANRSAALTEQLLAFSRAPSSNTGENINVDPVSCMNEIRPLLETLCGTNVKLRLNLPESLPAIRCEKTQLEQVLMNLVVNATDAMDSGGEITIDAYLHDDQDEPMVKITVTDTGCGMDEKTKARVLEPFFTTKPPGKGTGLGLCTVHGIVRQHDGHLDIFSVPNKGTSISAFFRATDQKVEDSGPNQRGVGYPKGSGQTILLVEDDNAVLALTSRILSSLGYHILEACDAKEAIELANEAKDSIELVLTDVAMPEMDGVALANKLKNMLPNIAILFMSGCMHDDLKKAGLDFARHKLLSKPVRKSTLAREVAQAIACRQPAAREETTKPRVFITDDDELILKAFSRTLEQDCHVSTFTTLDDLFHSLDKDPLPDVILCDLHLQGKTATDIIHRLDKADHEVRSRILFTTGGLTERSERKAVDESGIPVVHKPITRHTLLENVRKIANGNR